jgi:hypothetical protein
MYLADAIVFTEPTTFPTNLIHHIDVYRYGQVLRSSLMLAGEGETVRRYYLVNGPCAW